MARYYNARGGCFSGDVLMADGSLRNTADVRAGDLVATFGDSPDNRAVAKVLCVMKTARMDGGGELTQFPGGLKITPWHPTLAADSGTWQFPSLLSTTTTSEDIKCPFVYSLLLSPPVDRNGEVKNDKRRAPAVNVSGVWCISLAHGIVDDKVASHSFFGTEAITDCLSKMRGWDNGHVELQAGAGVRDPKTGLIVYLVQEHTV